jgi:hypothetical protein
MGVIALTRTVVADAAWNTFIRTTLEANQVSFTLVILRTSRGSYFVRMCFLTRTERQRLANTTY